MPDDRERTFQGDRINIMKYDCIFCDLDGPLLEGKYRHYQCYQDILTENGAQPIEIETYWKLKRENTPIKKILELSGFEDRADLFYEEWIKRIEAEPYLAMDQLQEHTYESLDRLKKVCSRLYLATVRNHRDRLMNQLRDFQLLSYFDEVLSGSLDKNGTKCDLIKDIPYQTALFIGDTPADAKTAQTCGIEFKGVLNGIRTKELLPGLDVYADLWELSNHI